jgi:hypothetical protein
VKFWWGWNGYVVQVKWLCLTNDVLITDILCNTTTFEEEKMEDILSEPGLRYF